jgi:serine/threonine-protein kinase
VDRARPGVPQHIRRRRARFAVAVVLLLAITIGAIGWWLGSGRWTDVPDLVGKSREAAVDLLQDAGLDPRPVVEQFSETVPAGTVISIEPQAGVEAIRGTDVEVLVSKGLERYVIAPELVQRPADEVEAELQESVPVQITRTEVFDDAVPAGMVTGFDPPAGSQLQREQVVTMLVSKGRAPVAVPDVTGQTPEQATANLQELGFEVTRGSDGRSATVDKGEVMAVEPPSGRQAPYGSTVRIQVSAGVPLVTVPDVVGMSEAEAIAALQAAGLQAESTRFFGSRVFRQSVSPGETVEQGTTVTILLTFG